MIYIHDASTPDDKAITRWMTPMADLFCNIYIMAQYIGWQAIGLEDHIPVVSIAHR